MKNGKILNYLIICLSAIIVGVAAYLLYSSLKPNKEEEKDKPLVIASSVKVNKSKLNITKGGSGTFAISVSGAAGVIDVRSNNNNFIEIVPNNSECNGTKCFFDAVTGSESTIEYNVIAKETGETTIDINVEDLVTYEEEDVSGFGTITVSVK